MASITNYGRDEAQALKVRKPLPPDPSCQPCPDCGGLECLCRPRFFAGQLLSEQDLNRLEDYIIEKNKLHNRHLFGSGVVCGLEVKCSPCDNGFVTVSSGYALSPCGEDIIVCKQDTVDICALIARCRVDSEPDCAPYRGQDSCGEVIEDWILSIRYAESPSRGITPLTGAGQSCGCSCAGPCSGKCGGGGTCGCGGGPACSCGAAQGLAEPEPLRQPRLNRGAPPSCEPTLTCETYRYDVFRAPEPDPVREPGRPTNGLAGVFGQLQGDMMENIACCLKKLQAALPPPPPPLTNNSTAAQRQAWFQWGCQMRTALANYIVKVGGHDCDLVASLQTIVIPSPNAKDFKTGIETAQAQFAIITFELMLDCICSFALPQCPAAADPRVPLALVKVRRGDCHVISVCNWTPLRKHVLTFPTLEYWFGFIPIIPAIRKIMHRICCELFGLRPVVQPRDDRVDSIRAEVPPGHPAGAAAATLRARAAPTSGGPRFSLNEPINMHPLADFEIRPELFSALLKRQSVGSTATLGDLARAMFEQPNMVVDRNLDDVDRANEIDRMSKSGLMAMFAGMTSFAAPLADMARSVVSAPQRDPEIAQLKDAVAKQSEELRVLKARVTRGFAARSATTSTSREAPKTSRSTNKRATTRRKTNK